VAGFLGSQRGRKLNRAGIGRQETLPSLAQLETPARPNIVLILADDQDVASIRYMCRLRSLLVDHGTTFKNAFVSDSLCCPSRAWILRSENPHNHICPGKCTPARHFRELYGLTGQYRINDNGRVVEYEKNRNYMTDVLAKWASGYIRCTAGSERPSYMYLAPKAPHLPAVPAERHEDAFSKLHAPRPPSLDEQDVRDKLKWVRNLPRLSLEQERYIDSLYRNRLRKMLAVDEIIETLVRELRDAGKLENTYSVDTSDHGFHVGHHRMTPAKWTAYEEDIRILLVVHGPGVPAGRVSEYQVLNNDFAPTFAELGQVFTPDFVAARSCRCWRVVRHLRRIGARASLRRQKQATWEGCPCDLPTKPYARGSTCEWSMRAAGANSTT
jgi:N-acetylglucosamine-6-sulfatase